MKTDPIVDIEKIRDVAEYLGRNNKRDEILVWMLVYTGLRIEDALDLRVRHLRAENGDVVHTVNVTENKTGRTRRVGISKKLRRELKDYLEGKPGYEYIFVSRKRSSNGAKIRITRQRAWSILNDAGIVFGIRLSPHALRKTFARQLYEKSKKDITVPMRALNHTSPIQTERYIGLEESTINSYVEELDF